MISSRDQIMRDKFRNNNYSAKLKKINNETICDKEKENKTSSNKMTNCFSLNKIKINQINNPIV